MASPDVVLEAIAVDRAGFPPILWRVVRDVLGNPTLPVYKVYECASSLAGSAYRADVHISPCRWGTKEPYLIHGGIMPTLETAIQVAAGKPLLASATQKRRRCPKAKLSVSTRPERRKERSSSKT